MLQKNIDNKGIMEGLAKLGFFFKDIDHLDESNKDIRLYIVIFFDLLLYV